MIDIIPFRRKKITTKLTISEVRRQIDLLFDTHTDLIGYTEQDKFTMERKIRYQNPLKPVVSGLMTEKPEGTLITINYRPKTLVLVFCTIFIAVFTAGAIKTVGSTNLEMSSDLQFLAAPWIFFILLMVGFNVERSKIEKRIKSQVA